MKELDRVTYKYVGAILALSIVYGGPAPQFFAESVADYFVYGFNGVQTTIEDIPDTLVKEKLTKVCALPHSQEYVCMSSWDVMVILWVSCKLEVCLSNV